MTIPVVVAEDHPMVAAGLRRAFADSEVRIVAIAATPDEVLPLVRSHQPEVLLLDVIFGQQDIFSALRQFRREFPGLAVVVLSAYHNPTYIARALLFGAADYVLKGVPVQTIITIVRNAAHGLSGDRKAYTEEVHSFMRDSTAIAEDDMRLSSRESQILRHLALGLNNREIGMSLNVSVDTIKEHVQKLLRRLQSKDRTAAAVWAIKRGYSVMLPSSATPTPTA